MEANVLVVDDSKLDRFFVRKLLEYLGVNVEEASGGRECLRLVRGKEYELILMDYLMPSPGGIETLKQIRGGIDNRNESTPVVAFVSPDNPNEGKICIEAGFDNFLEKPIDFKQLIASLIMYFPDNLRKELKLPSNNITKKAQKKIETKPEEITYENEILNLVSEVEDINLKEGISLCGSEDGYITALGIFYNSIDAKADEIEMFYKNEDWNNYTIKVHALKSSGNLIGAQKLRADAKEMEDAGNDNDILSIREKTEDLIAYYRGFKEKLKFLGEDEEQQKPDITEDALNDAYSALLEFTDSMDFDLADMVINSMKDYTLPEKDKGIFEEIEKKLSGLDWDGIRELISSKQ